ncbi:MAG: hypothetical protein GX557_09005 [Chloroflexi bacterium]|nr:hypothetical protein [Chloroflexota bacterium]
MVQAAPEELSAREREILQAVVTGATNQQIALSLHVSVNTVKAHLRNIFEKLGVQSRTEATMCAIQRGLVEVAGQPRGAAAPEAQSVSAGQPESTPPLPAPHSLVTPVSWLQRSAVLFVALLLIAVAVWPATQAASQTSHSPLVDLPLAPRPLSTPTASLRWQTRTPLPTPRGRFALAQLDGQLLVIGGLSEEGWSARVDAYDAALDRWEQRADKPTAVANIGAAVVDGRVYVAGGNDAEDKVLTRVEVYDPATDTWSTTADLPAPLCAYAVAATPTGFFLLGGWDGQRYVDTVHYYDVASDTWQTRAPLPSPRGFAAAAPLGERIYVVGGQDADGELALCQSYAPALDTPGNDPWQTHTPMNVGRAGHGLVPFGGALYVVGGGWGNYVTYNERYAPERDAWSTYESPLAGEWRSLGLAAIEAPQGTYLYAVGGWSGSYLSAVRTYQIGFRAYIPVQ